MKNRFYITTPVYYVNDEPHLGHSYTSIAVDILARWNRKLGKEVFFLTGTDEHGQKVKESAEKQNLSPEEFVDSLVPKFKELLKKSNVSYDFFVRTTDNYHRAFVKNIIKIMENNEDIYKGEYSGHYCVGCEQYYTETEVPDLICPIHKKKLVGMKEETYFFKLSKYQDKLLKYYEEHPEFLSPSNRAQEIINRVKEGLNDLSISRKDLDWGIEFPDDKEHSVYVWVDALCNYISSLVAAGEQTFWPADVHMVGKDIYWFHTVIWPAMLMSTGYELPKKVFAHGWWTVDGVKMSKSLGNVIKPLEMIEKYGVDTYRFFLFKLPFGDDVNLSEEDLVNAHNNELANDLGNLVSRVIAMNEKYFQSEIGKYEITNKDDLDLVEKTKIFEKVKEEFEEIKINRALETIWGLVRDVNAYINKVEPWKVKDEQRLLEICGLLVSVLKLVAKYIEIFMPGTAKNIAKQLNINLLMRRDKKFELELIKNHKLGEKEILFEKIKVEKPEIKVKNKSNSELKVKKYGFASLNLKVGKIVSIKQHPNAEKLYIEEIDLGEDENRQVISGLKDYYTLDELKGRNVIVVANLKPAKLRGEKSYGMLLVAENESESSEGDNKKLEIGLLETSADIGTNLVLSKDEVADNESRIEYKDFEKVVMVSDGKTISYDGKTIKAGSKKITIDKKVVGNIC